MSVAKWPLLINFDTSAIEQLDELFIDQYSRSEHIRCALDEYIERNKPKPSSKQYDH